MEILEISELQLPEIKIIHHKRFSDDRGHFTEPYQQSAFQNNETLHNIFGNQGVVQINESHSKPSTIRGLHMQWAPPQGKLIRTLWGHMVDIIVDVRPGSARYGKGIMYDMPADPASGHGELVWIPFGFAHGNYYPEESKIEYMVTAEWSGPEGEGGISPFAKDIDWSLCDPHLLAGFKTIANNTPLITSKDRDGYTVASWKDSANSKTFRYRA